MSIQKPPLVNEPVSLREKSQKKTKSGHAVHKAGIQSQSEFEKAEKGSDKVSSRSHKAPHSLPKKEK
jgi:hypothetical protein